MDQTVIGLLIGLVVGAGIVYAVLNANFKRILESKDRADADIREAAQREAETIRREAEAVRTQANALKEKAEADAARLRGEAELRARDEALVFQNKLETELRQKFEQDSARDRESLKSDRESLKSDRDAFKLEREGLRSEREELRLEGERLSRRGEQLDARASKLDQVEESLENDKKRNADLQHSLEQKIAESERKLFEVANLSREEAAKLILDKLDGELEEEKLPKPFSAVPRRPLRR
jgi:ribonucrease Y